MEQRFYIPEHRFSPCALRRFLCIRVTRKVPLSNQRALMKFHSDATIRSVKSSVIIHRLYRNLFCAQTVGEEMFRKNWKSPPLSFEK